MCIVYLWIQKRKVLIIHNYDDRSGLKSFEKSAVLQAICRFHIAALLALMRGALMRGVFFTLPTLLFKEARLYKIKIYKVSRLSARVATPPNFLRPASCISLLITFARLGHLSSFLSL